MTDRPITIIYQLVASGPSQVFDGRLRVCSRKVFRCRADAEAHKAIFLAACGNSDFLNYLDPATADVSIQELELND